MTDPAREEIEAAALRAAARRFVGDMADALYADAELGPGYMLREDCEHLAARVAVALPDVLLAAGYTPPGAHPTPEVDALDSLPIAALLHERLASWFGDDRQSFLVSDLVPVVTQIVGEFQYNAVDMARKADQAERRAEEAEFHVEQLRDARDSAERRNERAERLIDSWEHDAPDHSNPVFIARLRECLRRDPAPVRLRGDECDHHWLDRPESDTRECLICGIEVAG